MSKSLLNINTSSISIEIKIVSPILVPNIITPPKN